MIIFKNQVKCNKNLFLSPRKLGDRVFFYWALLNSTTTHPTYHPSIFRLSWAPTLTATLTLVNNLLTRLESMITMDDLYGVADRSRIGWRYGCDSMMTKKDKVMERLLFNQHEQSLHISFFLSHHSIQTSLQPIQQLHQYIVQSKDVRHLVVI